MPLSENQRILILVAVASGSALLTTFIARTVIDARCSKAAKKRVKIQSPPFGVKRDPLDPSARPEYLSWDDYFMAVAFLSAQRSKDPNKQVGACIVGVDHIILGIGYNGFPRGCPDGKLPWAKVSTDGSSLGTKYPYVVHAEANSILNAKITSSLAGASIYVTMFPCNECAKLIIQAGIREVVYYEDKQKSKPGTAPNEAYQASCQMLSMAGVGVRQHRLELPLTLQAFSH